MTLLVDNSHCENKDAKSEMSAVNTAIMFGIVALAAVLLGAGFFQLTKDMHSNISMIVVNGGKQPPAKEVATKVNNAPIPAPVPEGDGGQGDGGGEIDAAPNTAPVTPLPAAPKNDGVIHPHDLYKGKLPPRGNQPS